MKIFLLLITFLFAVHFNSYSQQKKQDWHTTDIFKINYFIENKGQFKTEKPNEKIVYGVERNNELIYFSETGFDYKLTGQKRKSEDRNNFNEEKEEQQELKANRNVEQEWLHMRWINSNEKVKILTEEKSSHYFSYGDKNLVSYGYKKITYQDLYPGIDVTFTLPDSGGVEYSLHVKAGADLSQYQFTYFSSIPLKLNLVNNQLRINNRICPFIEKNLNAFYTNGKKVLIKYVLNKNILQFKPEIEIDNNADLIIDPWFTALTTLTGSNNGATHNSNNCGYDVDTDASGNLYVYGGGGGSNSNILARCKVAKYDINGNLLWTFMGYVPSISWEAIGSNGSQSNAGNFLVDKVSSKIYVSQGFINTGARLVRLSAAGIYDNFVSTIYSDFQEMWELKFNCADGSLIAMGGGTLSNLNFGIVDTVTGDVVTSNITGNGAAQQDITNAVINDQGEVLIYFNSLTNSIDQHLMKLNSTYSGLLWNVANQSMTFYYQNKPYGNTNSQGINCLAVNQNYVFFYDGFYLNVFDQLTGAQTLTSVIGNGSGALMHAGIQANNCDDIYIGWTGEIFRLHYNGTSFDPLDTIAIDTGSYSFVHDIVLNPVNNLLYVAGSGFVGIVDPQNSCAASSADLQLTLSILCPDSAMVEIQNGNLTTPYSFIWFDQNDSIIASTSNQVGSLSNKIGGLSANVPYSVQVVVTNSCQILIDTIHFNVTCFGQYFYICHGDSVQLAGGEFVNTPGFYIDTIPSSVFGIDSIVFSTVNLYPLDTSTVTVVLCSGQSYTLPSGQVVSIAGTYIDTLINILGCDSIITTTISFIPLNIAESVTVCEGEIYTLPGGTTVDSSGIYIDTLTNILGCDSIVTTHLTVFPLMYYTQNKIICDGDILILPDGQQATLSGTYTSTIVSSYGCDSIITTNLQTVDTPFINLGNDTMLCNGSAIVLNAKNKSASYSWNTGSVDSVIMVANPGTYNVKVTLLPCPVIEDEIVITFRNCDCIKMPTAFSPNGDGVNDAVKPLTDCPFNLNPYEYCIYNRWGELIFKTTDTDLRWDGKYNNVEQEVGVYVFTVRFYNPVSNETVYLNGNISLLR